MKGLIDCGLDINESKWAAMNLIIHQKCAYALHTIPYVLMIVNWLHRFIDYINVKLINLSKADLKLQQNLDLLKVFSTNWYSLTQS